MSLLDCLCAAAIVLAAIVSCVTGYLVAIRYLDPAEPAPAQLDPSVEEAIEQAAVHWAQARGRPWAAPLIADKLRLVYRLGNHDDIPQPPLDRWPS